MISGARITNLKRTGRSFHKLYPSSRLRCSRVTRNYSGMLNNSGMLNELGFNIGLNSGLRGTTTSGQTLLGI